MNTRILKLRKDLNLTQEAFGKRLGVRKTAISKLEKGENNLTEQMIKLICTEFKVNEKWLRTGEGDPFDNVPKDELDKLAERYNLEPLAKKIVESFVTLGDDEMRSVIKFVKDIASSAYDEISATADDAVEKQIKAEIDADVEAYRLERWAEKKGIISSVSEDIKESQGN